MPSLTLCLIARNEEQMLPACLESARPAVDRMLVVDTGSSDGTKEVARRLGAEVVEHEWQDDFSAARNAALEHVSSGYVLVLDADERLTKAGARRLRKAARRGEVELGLMPLHQASSLAAEVPRVLRGEARIGEPLLVPRFLRRTPDLRWEGIVHESVASWALRGRRVAELDAPIVHYGGVPELRRDLDKADRNRLLLERRCELEPDNPMPFCYLAVEHRRRLEPVQALREARHAWEKLLAERERGADHHDAVFPATVFVEALLTAGELDEAEDVLRSCLEWEDHPNLHLLLGVSHEARCMLQGGSTENLVEAEAHYLRALAFRNRSFASELMPGATTWEASTRLGTVRLLLGRPDEAHADFSRALEFQRGHREAELGRAEARIDAGDPQDALRQIEELASVQDPDLWLLAARAAAATGAGRDVEIFVARARELRGGHLFVSRHRERALVELERALEAASPLAGDPGAETRVFAWPRYDGDGELEVLVRDYAKPLAEAPGAVLCLRHDPELDGDAEQALQRFEALCAQLLPAATPLQVLLLDQRVAHPDALSKLARESDIALELPSAAEEARGRFLEALGARRVASAGQLDEALSAELQPVCRGEPSPKR